MTERDQAKLIDNLSEAAAILRWSRYDVPLAAWRDDAAAPDYLASVEHVARALLESVAASGQTAWTRPLSLAILLDYLAQGVAASFAQPAPPPWPVEGCEK